MRLLKRLVGQVSTLAVETSCDDTCMAIVSASGNIKEEMRVSHSATCKAFGGVVPSVSSAAHDTSILEICYSMANSKESFDSVCCTIGPGLFPCLSRGILAAKLISVCKSLPFFGCHHMEGHIYSSHTIPIDVYPFLCILISGGHTLIVAATGPRSYVVVSQSLDDNIGEVYDKLAREIPADIAAGNSTGSLIEKLAANAQSDGTILAGGFINGASLDFSFSGIKTEAIKRIKEAHHHPQKIYQVCRHFQCTMENLLVEQLRKSFMLLRATGISPQFISVGGGVSRNLGIRNAITKSAEELGLPIHFPKLEHSTDNAAMIGLAFQRLKDRHYTNYKHPIANFPLGFLKDDDGALENYT